MRLSKSIIIIIIIIICKIGNGVRKIPLHGLEMTPGSCGHMLQLSLAHHPRSLRSLRRYSVFMTIVTSAIKKR